MIMGVVKEIMEQEGVKTGELATRLKMNTSTMSQRFTQDNVSVKVLEDMMLVMGYKLMAVPIKEKDEEGNKKPSYRISYEEGEGKKR